MNHSVPSPSTLRHLAGQSDAAKVRQFPHAGAKIGEFDQRS
jgi:hypothetical protein